MGGKGGMNMALKEKALKRMAEKLNAAGVPYALGAGWLLCQKGILPVYHDFDVTLSPADAQAADRILSRLGMRSEAREEDGCFHASYHFDGADVDLCAGMVFPCGLKAVFGPDSVSGSVSVFGAPVPMGRLEDWLVWYALAGRAGRTEALVRYFSEHGSDCPQRFRACVDGPLPEAVEALVRPFC